MVSKLSENADNWQTNGSTGGPVFYANIVVNYHFLWSSSSHKSWVKSWGARAPPPPPRPSPCYGPGFCPKWTCSWIRAVQFFRSGRARRGNLESCGRKKMWACLESFHFKKLARTGSFRPERPDKWKATLTSIHVDTTSSEHRFCLRI